MEPRSAGRAVEEYNIALHKANEGTAKPKDYDVLDVLAKYVRNVGSSATESDGPEIQFTIAPRACMARSSWKMTVHGLQLELDYWEPSCTIPGISAMNSC
jgi:hypothetical protein